MHESDSTGAHPAMRSAVPSILRRRPRTCAAAAAVAGALLLGGVPLAALQGTPAAVAASAEMPSSFAELAARVTPAVVNISSTRKLANSARDSRPELPFGFPEGSPFEEFFKHFREEGRQGGHDRMPREAAALGSGFIVDADGHIVTNNHVIDGATDIQVTLNDGDEYPAKVIGRDAKTDLALLKIDASEPLPAVRFGDSDAVQVGDWVLAVGNPFGLGGTVTSGIVSARGRDIHSGPFDDYLQIDASINQGNSGGPTFTLDGNVVGVNTAIYSPSGGSVGIGFAIPSNLAKSVIAELREHGRVERGWLGVQIQPVTPEIAEALGMDEPAGALVARVEPDSPAARAKLRSGDVILGFDGKEIGTMRDLPRLVAAVPAGGSVDVTVWRDKARTELEVEIAKLQEQTQADVSGSAGEKESDGTAQDSALLGLTLAPLTPELKQEYGIADTTNGVLVLDTDADGPAAEQGIQAGDVIEKVAQEAVSSPAQVQSLAEEAHNAKTSLLLLVHRDGTSRFVAVKLGQA